MSLISCLKRFFKTRTALSQMNHGLQIEYRGLSQEQPKPRITVPHRMMKKIEKIKMKQAAERHQQKSNYKGPLIISCKRKEFDHYRGQTYKEFSQRCLASRGWKRTQSAGDYFTINAYAPNPAVQNGNDKAKGFKQLGLGVELVKALEDMGITTPTNIQVLAIPEILQGMNTMCIAETGSGKTLAYVLPIIEKILRHREAFGNSDDMNAPYAVILVPSRELAEQIHGVLEDFTKYVNISPHCVIGGHHTQAILKWRPKKPMDIVVSTPGVLSKILTNRIYKTKNLLQIVLDEADSLMDDSFGSLTCRIISKLCVVSEKLEIEGSISTVGTQVALVGATVPRDLSGILGDIVPLDTIKTIKTEYIHKVMPHVAQKFLRVKKSEKPDVLMKTVSANAHKKIATIVFCNAGATACFLSYMLEDNLIPHVLLTANLPRKVREGKFKSFQEGEVDIMLCTDVASRGLDTVRVRHVINYDFPSFISDYVHRVGRVGRVNSHGSGFCLSFIANPFEVDLLWNIETSVRRTKDFYNVNANIKRKLVGLHDTDNLDIQNEFGKM